MSEARDLMGHRMRARLSAAGVRRGKAIIQGVLYDLGRYPGLVDSLNDIGRATAVTGEIIELSQPLNVFRWLDHYEGIDPNRPQTSEYKRVIRQVESETGALTAWVYMHKLPSNRLHRIDSGDWLEYAARKCVDVLI